MEVSPAGAADCISNCVDHAELPATQLVAEQGAPDLSSEECRTTSLVNTPNAPETIEQGSPIGSPVIPGAQLAKQSCETLPYEGHYCDSQATQAYDALMNATLRGIQPALKSSAELMPAPAIPHKKQIQNTFAAKSSMIESRDEARCVQAPLDDAADFDSATQLYDPISRSSATATVPIILSGLDLATQAYDGEQLVNGEPSRECQPLVGILEDFNMPDRKILDVVDSDCEEDPVISAISKTHARSGTPRSVRRTVPDVSPKKQIGRTTHARGKKQVIPPKHVVLKYGRPAKSQYITSRCKEISGLTVGDALSNLRFKDERGGGWRNYTLPDLRYDLSRGFLVAESQAGCQEQRRQPSGSTLAASRYKAIVFKKPASKR